MGDSRCRGNGRGRVGRTAGGEVVKKERGKSKIWGRRRRESAKVSPHFQCQRHILPVPLPIFHLDRDRDRDREGPPSPQTKLSLSTLSHHRLKRSQREEGEEKKLKRSQRRRRRREEALPRPFPLAKGFWFRTTFSLQIWFSSLGRRGSLVVQMTLGIVATSSINISAQLAASTYRRRTSTITRALHLCNSTTHSLEKPLLFSNIPSSLHSNKNIRLVKSMAATSNSYPSVSGNKQALISLSDKQDLAFLGNELQSLGFTIVSTGGTASALESAGIPVTKVEQLTSFPEMLDGRVKTLHPNIHGGILARRDQKHHMEALDAHGIGTFDLVVVNLYPFYAKVSSTNGITFEDGVENIDIGGPAMIRAAAKNHKDVLVVVDSKDYPALIAFLKGSQDDQSFRRKLAWKAFQHVASYDSAVAEWMWKQTVGDEFPPSLTVPLSLQSSLRYGENPHQKAAFYVDKSLSEVNAGGIATAVQHHGKEMSYNNYLDADAAWNCVCEFRDPTCVIVKHTNPCGVASRENILEAYRLAVKADPVSAFGGIVAFNIEVDEDLAKEIREFRSPTDGETRMFYEIVVAPKYSQRGLEILRGKSKTLRILEAGKNEKGKLSLRQVGGGWLAQDSDDLTPQDIQFNIVSKKTPEENELRDAEFAWLCVKHVKSNAIVIAKNDCMLGMGSGQPNRLESLRIALRKAGDEVKGAALASDAFFPFAWKDAVEEACESGIGTIAEPGGSIRDGDAIDCCNKYGVSLVFTNVRHFRH